ncbi:hypothetical protein, partial [Salmonella sp. SAL4457]|uniref:hypothetical protein n=1 Tax=Salmonella sp. SAL4457 TaxID=3159912 RepID=UPI00397BA681
VGVNRYLAGTSLIGSVDEAVAVVDAVREVDVDEIACLVDFVDDADRVVAGIGRIAELAARTA